MTVTPLGVSAAIPAHGRHLSAVAVAHGPHLVLLDCGEGTQFRLAAAGLAPLRVDVVCITHLHGDHFFGLPGLLSTMAMLGRQAPLTLAGPEGLWDVLDAIPSIGLARPPFEVQFVGWRAGETRAVVFESRALRVVGRALDHRVPTMGYRLEEAPRAGNLDVERARALGLTDWADYRTLKAGRSVVAPDGRTITPVEVVRPAPPPRAVAYVTDTRPCEGGRLLARTADLVLHDATFGDAFADRARETGHSTAREAAAVARDAGARRLLLTHLSARHPDPAVLVDEARVVFPATDAAEELAHVVVAPAEDAAGPAEDAVGPAAGTTGDA